MMVKVFTTNKDGKVEFTKEELENLLNEVWQDGRNSSGTYWWTSPTITNPNWWTTTPNTYGTEITCKLNESK